VFTYVAYHNLIEIEVKFTIEWRKQSSSIHAEWKDDVHCEDIKEFMFQLNKYTEDNNIKKRKVILDLSNCNLVLTPDDLKELSQLSGSLSKGLIYSCLALVANKPNETAFAMMFTRESPSKNLFRNTFSSFEAAEEWIIETEHKIKDNFKVNG
jgi:hypothetical protein